MPELDVEVLVIGGGPVGMVLASEMARWGVPCRIVDKKRTTVQHSNAVGVQVRTQEVLDAMGLGEAFQASGFHQQRLNAFAYGRRLGQIELDAVDSPYKGLLSIGQNVTEKILADHLARVGVTVERPVVATAFAQDADGCAVTLTRADGTEERVRARWVVSCEGSGSMVRQTLGIPFEGERYEHEVFCQTDCLLRWSFPRGVYMFLNEGLAVVVSPYDETGYSRVICAMVDTDPDNREPPTLQEMQDYVRRGADPDAELCEPVGWLTRYRTQHRLAARFREGRAFLCGDAGHVHVPIGGQGMNTGMQDAFNLAWKLAHVVKGWARPDLLDTYQAERHPVAEALIRGTDTGYKTLIQPSHMTESLIRTVAPLALRLGSVRDRLIRASAEIDIAYKRSAIVRDAGGDGLAAGSRVPDAPLVRGSDKKDARLYDLLRGPKWTLLILDGREAPDESDLALARDAAIAAKESQADRLQIWRILVAGEIPSAEGSVLIAIDRLGAVHAALRVTRPALILVRPDFYIGFKGRISDASTLLDYLKPLSGV